MYRRGDESRIVPTSALVRVLPEAGGGTSILAQKCRNYWLR